MLSRLWYFAVAAVAAFAIAAVLGAQTTVNSSYKTSVDGQLIRDRVEIELWLRLDARQRIDSIASMAGNTDVHEYLRAASTRREVAIDPALRKKLASRLSSLNSQLERVQHNCSSQLIAKA